MHIGAPSCSASGLQLAPHSSPSSADFGATYTLAGSPECLPTICICICIYICICICICINIYVYVCVCICIADQLPFQPVFWNVSFILAHYLHLRYIHHLFFPECSTNPRLILINWSLIGCLPPQPEVGIKRFHF